MKIIEGIKKETRLWGIETQKALKDTWYFVKAIPGVIVYGLFMAFIGFPMFLLVSIFYPLYRFLKFLWNYVARKVHIINQSKKYDPYDK